MTDFIVFYQDYRFEILGISQSWCENSEMQHIKISPTRRHSPLINGKEKYSRIFVQKRLKPMLMTTLEEKLEYVAQLMEYEKKFIIIGNQNAITYKEIFPYIKNNQLWMGLSMNGSNRWFQAPDDYEVKANAAGYKEIDGKKYYFVNGVAWFTNMPHNHRNEPLDLYKKYSSEYPKYDNYDAIEVSRVENIPMDYDGVMGVPITFLYKYCPEQFEIVGQASSHRKMPKRIPNENGYINGKWIYSRILIKRKKYEKKFIIIGSDNARTYKETFPLLKENKMWIGINHIKDFVQPNKSIKSFGNISWFTNMEHSRRNEPLDLYKKYSSEYPKYDNYDAIEVSKVAEIPMDYDGVMGVPISFLDKYCPMQFEIIGLLCDNRCGGCMINGTPTYTDEKHKHSVCGVLNGKRVYPRILIKRKPKTPCILN